MRASRSRTREHTNLLTATPDEAALAIACFLSPARDLLCLRQGHLGSPNTAPSPSQPALTGLAREQRAQRVRLVLAVAAAVAGPGGRCRCCRAGRGAHQGYPAAGWCRRCAGSRASSALAHNGGQRRAVTAWIWIYRTANLLGEHRYAL